MCNISANCLPESHTNAQNDFCIRCSLFNAHSAFVCCAFNSKECVGTCTDVLCIYISSIEMCNNMGHFDCSKCCLRRLRIFTLIRNNHSSGAGFVLHVNAEIRTMKDKQHMPFLGIRPILRFVFFFYFCVSNARGFIMKNESQCVQCSSWPVSYRLVLSAKWEWKIHKIESEQWAEHNTGRPVLLYRR